MDHQPGVGARRPHRVVGLVAVRRLVVPHGGHHDPLDAGLAGQRLDLAHRLVDVVHDRHEGHTGPPGRVGGTELLEPAVVGPSTGEREVLVGDLPRREPGPERRRLHPGDRVAVGEDHLAGDAVGVELLVAHLGVEGPAQTLLVVTLPLLDVVAVDLLLEAAVGVALLEPLVELRVVLRLQVVAVLRDLQAGMGVRRDDDVRVVARVDPFERIRHAVPSPRAAVPRRPCEPPVPAARLPLLEHCPSVLAHCSRGRGAPQALAGTT